MAANKAKLSQFDTKTLDEMINEAQDPYIPAVDKDRKNFKIPVSNFFDTFKSSGGASNFVVLQDDGAIVPLEERGSGSNRARPYFASYEYDYFDDYSGESTNYVRYSLFQDGAFNTPVWKRAIDVKPFKRPVYAASNGLKLNDVNHIIWNTWYGLELDQNLNLDPFYTDIYSTPSAGQQPTLQYRIFRNYCDFPLDPSIEPTSKDDQGCLYCDRTDPSLSSKNVINGFTKLYLDVHDMVEGLVYEITINIRKLAWGNGSIKKSFCNTDGTMGFKITFYDDLSQVNVYKWAQDDKPLNTYVCPNFLTATTSTDNMSSSANHCTQFPVLAFAKVYFVKVDGKIYIMGY